VIDFSTMTDRAVIEYLSSAKGVCGIFRRDQVNRTLTLYRPYNGFLNWKVGLIGLLPLLSFKCEPQQPMMGKAIAPTHIEQKPLVKGEPMENSNIPISGCVHDEYKNPLTGAVVMLIDTLTSQAYQTVETDKSGHFSFQIQLSQSRPHQAIRVYHPTYSAATIQLGVSHTGDYQIVLHEQQVMIMGDVVEQPKK
jgi:hypothetical protein